MILHKDLALDQLAKHGNVAQFVAFRPEAGTLVQWTARVTGMAENARFESVPEAVTALLAKSGEGAVNVRSYLPEDPRSREFVYGIADVDTALGHLQRLGAEGLHLILNETIDIHDGGVSGVTQGNIIEFAPDDTPRAVEKPDAASLPRDMGLAILETVYGFAPELPDDRQARVEFSIHPDRRGWRQTHTILWEIEPGADARTAQVPRWPNRFSRHIGDKCFGLLIADQLGAPVPLSHVTARRVRPFSFGQATGSDEVWTRTCPAEPQPGRFITVKGSLDPAKLFAEEDPESEIASVLVQDAVPAAFSGAAIVGGDGTLIVEGLSGEGDAFMLGIACAQPLPGAILGDVQRLHAKLTAALGPVRIEWVHDGQKAWVVQLHVGATASSATALVAGEAANWLRFDVTEGLEALRAYLLTLPDDVGLVLEGDVGLTSHVADLVRKRGRPARIERG
jgi:hypothetical protein